MAALLFILFLFPGSSDSLQSVYPVVEGTFGQFNGAVAFSIAPTQEIFVVDQKPSLVYKFAPDGKKHSQFGGKGWGNYEFDGPTDVSSSFLLDVFVTDYNNRRIQRYDARSNHVQTIDENSLPQSVGRFYPKGCALSSLGDLFVIETDGKRILKLNKRLQLEQEFGTYKDGNGALSEPKDIAISQTDEIFVLDGTKIIAYDLFGNYIRTMNLPEGEWRSLQVSGDILVATAPRIIAAFSVDGSKQQAIKHDSIVGIPSAEDFVDAMISGDRLIILTSSTIYFCSLH